MHSETPTATPRFGPTPGSPEPSYTMVIRPRHPTGRAKIDERDICSDSEVEGFSLVDSSNHPLHIPYRPALAKKPPVKEPVDVPFEEWAEFQDVDEWQNVDAYPKPGMCRQLDLADSSATIKPMAASSAATRMQAPIEEEDSLGYDSEWSVVDKPVAKAVSFA